MDGRCDEFSGTDIPSGSNDFQLVLHQLQIHDTWIEAVDKATEREDKSMNNSERVNFGQKDDDNPSKNRTNSFSKLKRFLNIKPQSTKCEKSSSHVHVTESVRNTTPHQLSLSPSSPRTPPKTSPTSPALHRIHLEVTQDYFRLRAHSDASAVNPRKKKQDIYAAAERLRVHWPDLEQGETLTTTLRPRSYSHGSGERPTKPILKKASSRTVYY